MDIVPGQGLGPFRLGLGVNDALSMLRNGFLPLRPKVDVIYSSKAPLKKDLVLRIRELGLQLRFDGISQRLRLIDAFDLGKIVLTHKGRAIAPRGKAVTFLTLYNFFGPTFPGSFDAKLLLYV